MKRRVFLIAAVGSAGTLAGCTSGSDNSNDGGETSTDTPAESTPTDEDSPENNTETPSSPDDDSNDGGETSTDTPAESTPTDEDSPENNTETPSSPEYDVVIDYSIHVQSSASGEYDLPEPRYDGWGWIVVDFEVVDGELDMEDVWFQGLTETKERYYTVSPFTDQVDDGIENRGAIREGGRGIMLHAYPPSPASEPVGPMFSATCTAIGGEGVGSDGPGDLYPPCSVEYSIETSQRPEVLPDEYATSDGDVWAVVSLGVTKGDLNLEDVWFRSQLTTDSRIYECHPYSRLADQGVRSRGIVKPGNSATALYQIAEDETVEEWGYTEDGRQDVSISRT